MLLDNEIQIGPAEWNMWLNNPVTIQFMEALGRERREWADRLVEGLTLKPGTEVVETAKTVGIIYGLDVGLEGVGEALRIQWQEAEKRKEEKR